MIRRVNHRITAPPVAPAVVAWAIGCGWLAGAAATEPATTEREAQAPADAGELASQRDAAYREFKAHFEAGRYNEALPAAERVAVLTEAIDPQHRELPSALNNLGATHYRLGDFIAAESAYSRALRLIEEHSGASSHRLIAPLLGLGLTYQSGGRNDAAAPLLERAVAISRHADGLFNPGQRELLLPLIDSYIALARWTDADREENYAFRVSERQYGSSDLRLLPALHRLARWYETGRRTNEARRVWQRMLAIASDRTHQSRADIVTALRGYAHTFRLDYQYGPDPSNDDPTLGPVAGGNAPGVQRDTFGRRVTSGVAADFRLDGQGREALEAALGLMQKSAPPAPPQAIAAVLLDLGDWQQVAGRWDKALPLYQRAWPALPTEAGTAEAPVNPLAHPWQLLYRAPPSARRYVELAPAAVTETVAIVAFTVTADGHVKDVNFVEGDAADTQRSALAYALARSTWRPRFVDGQPVATEKVRFRETFRQAKH